LLPVVRQKKANLKAMMPNPTLQPMGARPQSRNPNGEALLEVAETPQTIEQRKTNTN
jgi:hypothetical protein